MLNIFNFYSVIIVDLKGCVRYILAGLFLSLKESTCETRKNFFFISPQKLFVLEKIKF